MKKQFNRMKQLANQTVGRAERTEVLSEDLLQIERRLDAVRSVCHLAQKRLIACLQGQHGTDPDKRHKKLPLTALAQNMQEGSVQLSDETLLGKMLDTCGDAENKLAMELSQHEVQIEREVIDPLCLLTETEIPNIQKQRKQLAKLVLDWDSARGRYNQAHKTSGTNFQVHPSKIESLKEEMDEAGNKVEQCKDQLAADMYSFVSKEGEYARCFVTLLEAQADYHRKALAVIEKVLPEIQAHQDKWTEKPAFGTPLEEHLKLSGREIAVPIEACVMMLLETGMREEGLFRIAAGASKLKKLKAALDCSTSQLDEFYSDPHAVAGALKSYLRELPEPLMTYSLYEEWTQAANIQDQDKKLQELWRICNRLPEHYRVNFRYLIKFLAKLAQNSDVNKMTPSNIAIVLGPNLLWAKNEGSLAEMAAATSVHVVAVIEPIIQHADWFFPGDEDFNVSGAFVAVPAVNSNHLSHTGNDYECGTLERKRPLSMTVMEGDLLKKESASKCKESTSAATPPPVRNGQAGPAPGQAAPSSSQLSVSQPQNAAGPSPHALRRAMKKPAPAPPSQPTPPRGSQAAKALPQLLSLLLSLQNPRPEAPPLLPNTQPQEQPRPPLPARCLHLADTPAACPHSRLPATHPRSPQHRQLLPCSPRAAAAAAKHLLPVSRGWISPPAPRPCPCRRPPPLPTRPRWASTRAVPPPCPPSPARPRGAPCPGPGPCPSPGTDPACRPRRTRPRSRLQTGLLQTPQQRPRK
uniref:Rho GTPase-activating protein 17 n=1 Tax=Geospiza parvula TaxID=87175 RepID=A0A8C3N8E0_GEOPR